MTILRVGVLAGLMAAGAPGQMPARIILSGTVSTVDTRGAEIADKNPWRIRHGSHLG